MKRSHWGQSTSPTATASLRVASLPTTTPPTTTTRVWRSQPAPGTSTTGRCTQPPRPTGSVCSVAIAKPAFQAGVYTGCSNRAEADVSAVADPNTGVAVYNTYGGAGGWGVLGGTSAAAPIIAAVYALAGTPGATDSPNAYPYAHPASLNDVTSGNNGTTCS